MRDAMIIPNREGATVIIVVVIIGISVVTIVATPVIVTAVIPIVVGVIIIVRRQAPVVPGIVMVPVVPTAPVTIIPITGISEVDVNG